MPEPVNTIRHSWLTSLLREQSDRVRKLVRSIAGLGRQSTLEPSLFHRFMKTLEQIALAKDEEEKLIWQIDSVEEEHRRNRTRKVLREAAPEPVLSTTDPLPEPMAEPKRDSTNIWWWLLFLDLVSRPKVNHK